MKNNAGGGASVVGNLGALVGGHIGVRLVRGDNIETSGGEQCLDARGQGKRDVFFENVIRKPRSRVRSSVHGIEEDQIAIKSRSRFGQLTNVEGLISL